MIVNGYEVKSNYIVAVATKKEYRHRGYMRILLKKALRDMADMGMPFVFLMPASESIYAPFDLCGSVLILRFRSGWSGWMRKDRTGIWQPDISCSVNATAGIWNIIKRSEGRRRESQMPEKDFRPFS